MAKKILIIMKTNIFSGAEFVLNDYLKNNNSHEFFIYINADSKVCGCASQYINYDRIYATESMKVISIRKRPISSILDILKNLLKMHQIICDNSIDVLYGNNTIDVVLVVLYKKFFNTKVQTISHVHDIINRQMYKKFIGRYQKYINQYIVPSIAVKESLKACAVPQEKVEVVYNGVEIPDRNYTENEIYNFKNSYKIPKDKIIIGFAGMLCQRKRPDLFVEIIEKLKNIDNRYFGVILGAEVDKTLASNLKKKVIDKKIPIKFIGQVLKNEMTKMYSLMDFFLLTSDNDPLPTVVLEAMAQRKIVIARDVDGVKEMISDGENGFLFNYDASVSTIADIIRNVSAMSFEQKEALENNMIYTIKKRFNNQEKQDHINKIIEHI